MSFHEILFPEDISYGSRGGPGFNTTIIQVDSGAEQRVRRWQNARRRYNVKYGVKDYDQLSALIDFYICRGGAAYGFRYKDWLDHSTASNHRDAPSATDQVLTAGSSSTQYQLVKHYTSGVSTETRRLTKIVSGSVLIAVDGVTQASGWSVDNDSGVVTFDSAPSGTVTGGCYFHVPVRFEKDMDNVFSMSMDDFGWGSAGPDINLIELVGEVGKPVAGFFFGGSSSYCLEEDKILSLGEGRVQMITPNTSGLSVRLPDPSGVPYGGPILSLVNANDTHSVGIKDHNGTLLKNLPPQYEVDVLLGIDGDDDPLWVLR